MLQHLTIQNLAIVNEADLSFGSGMTSITGETGAGKSILLDALNLVLGQRADSNLIQPGAEKAEVSATFDIAELPDAVLWLNDLELSQKTQDCLIRRMIYPNGRSRAFINGVPATTQQLKMLGEYLVQMHGQHKHQVLLQAREQLRILDTYGKHQTLVANIKKIYFQHEKLLKQKKHLSQGDDSAQYQAELFQYQIEEIEKLELAENEITKLYEDHDKLAHAQTTLEACQEAVSYLDNEESGNALQLMNQAKQNLQPLFQKYSELGNAKDCLESATIQLQEALSELNLYIQNLEINPAALNSIEQRLDRIHEIARKHKIEPEKIHSHYQSLVDKLNILNQDSILLEEIDEEIALCEAQYQKISIQLSKKRLSSAKKLEKEITKHIQNLGMQGAQFAVQCEQQPESFSATGIDQVTFCISANIGHPPKPLTKVASGGELSRISLALELTTLQDITSPTLIFDEVDVGIGGKTGAIVGRYLHQLSQKQQVICITHLPQVAAFGDQHLMVSKQNIKNKTQTQITQLTQDQRVEEIARMLGGLNISGEAKAQAKHLLEREKEVEPL
tara:strand:- start:89 stop:1774 length:1686 start_codon:yes stop_codon:yes gene_type:complete